MKYGISNSASALESEEHHRKAKAKMKYQRRAKAEIGGKKASA
jgi:hypothetical protein